MRIWEEQQRHLNVGLDKLRETVTKVRDLRANLAEKQGQLEKKGKEFKGEVGTDHPG